jgi:hypothetical protein
MALVTIAEARAAAGRVTERLYKSTSAILKEQAEAPTRSSFDVFLSHSYMDKDIVLGAKKLLEERELSVYVDWVDDAPLNRGEVNPETAARLKLRMAQSNSLFYLHTSNAQSSKWMPWELGYFDALKGKVAVFPLLASSDESFKGQEYLGLYPYVDLTGQSIWIHKSTNTYKRFIEWPSRW